MIVYALGIPLLMVVAALDAGVMVQVRYLNGGPSLLLMVITSWALLNDLSDALPWAVIGGIYADMLSVSPIGASSIAFTLGVVAIAQLLGQANRHNWVLPPLAVAIMTILYQLVIMVILIFFGWSVPIFGAGLRWMIPSLIANLIGILFIFRTMGAIIEFFRPPSVR